METDSGDNSGLHDNNLPDSEDKAVHEEEEQQEDDIEVSEDVRAGEERDLHPLCSSTTSSTSTFIPHQLHHRHSPEEDAHRSPDADD